MKNHELPHSKEHAKDTESFSLFLKRYQDTAHLFHETPAEAGLEALSDWFNLQEYCLTDPTKNNPNNSSQWRLNLMIQYSKIHKAKRNL